MLTLAEWESRLQSSILDIEDHLGDAIRPSHLPQSLRLEIYQNAYLLRLAEALRSNFPCLYSILGEDAFGHMLLRYLKHHRPSSFSIRWFGDQLSSFLESEQSGDGDELLAEIARFEWAIRHTVDASNASVISVDQLLVTTPEDWLSLRLCLHPSVTLLQFEHNSVAVWQAYLAEDRAEIPPVTAHASDWIVYRDGEGRAAWRSLLPLELPGLLALLEGSSFPDLCDAIAKVASTENDAAQITASFFKGWVAEGLIIHDEMNND